MRISSQSAIRNLVYSQALMATVILAATAQAQSSVTYELGESARLLEASLKLERGEISQSQYNAIQMDETCKNPFSRLQDRNRPWISVFNTSQSADEITSVTIDLTEPGFVFGDGDSAGDGFDGLLSMLHYRSDDGVELDSATHGEDSSELVLNFSGLTAGMAAIFRLDLDQPGGMFDYPDFRVAMLGADVGNGPGGLAMLTSEFSSGASNTSMFPRSDGMLDTAMLEDYHAQSMSPIIPSSTVPEPTSLLLLLAGVASAASVRRYR